MNHLLLHCSKARILWYLIFSLFGVVWVMHSFMEGNLLGWHGLFVGKKPRKALNMFVLNCLEGNEQEVIFNDVEQLDQTIKSNYMYAFVNWVRAYIKYHSMSNRSCRWVVLQVRRGCLFVCPLLAQIGHLLYILYVLWCISFQALSILMLICL